MSTERHPEPTYICSCGAWFGWVMTAEPSEKGTLTVKPCARCRAEAFQRWAQGHWDRRANRGATR